MPITHCLPSGSLGTAELPVQNVSPSTVSMVQPATGLRRGVVVFMHGLISIAPATPYPMIDITATLIPEYVGTLAAILAADGWVVFQPMYNEDNVGNCPSLSIYNDIVNDPGTPGARYLTNTLHWWDHVVAYVQSTWGNWPIIPLGVSWGGWHALQVAANKASTVTAYAAHIPVTILSNLNPSYSGPSSNFGVLGNTTGLDIATSLLNAVTLPGIIGYGTSDSGLGYNGVTTVAVGSNGVAASAVTTLSVASSITMTVGPLVKVTGLTGGTGTATFAFTGTGVGTLTGVTLVSGSGTLATNNPVVQSQTTALITAQQAAQPSHQVVANITTDFHELLPSDSGQQLTGVASATALSAITSMTVATVAGMSGASTHMAIYASDGLWHTVTFSGTSGGITFTGCTFSGTQTATVINGSPICLSGNGASNQMSYPYWFSTVVDPLCPKTY